MLSFEEVIADHDRINDRIAALGRSARDAAISPSALFADLCELAIVIGGHLRFEDISIYARVMQTTSSEKEADALDRAFEQLKEDWLAYLREWSLECIAADRAAFAAATNEMLGRVQQRVATETRLLYAPGLQRGVLALRHSSGKRS